MKAPAGRSIGCAATSRVGTPVASIERAFDALPDDYKEAISLHRMVGLSHAEIAAHMGRTEGAVRNLVYRGLALLAMRLGEGGQR